jgi:DNA replication protein DnaC
MVLDTLRAAAAKLRLSGLLQGLGPRLQEAAGNSLTHAEFRELVFGDEIAVRAQRAVERGKKRAAFRELRTLEDFDFTFNKSIKRQQVYGLATCHFIAEDRDILFIGPPGVGKSHLAQAIGYQAVKGGHSVLYTSVFDLVRDLLHEEDVPSATAILDRFLHHAEIVQITGKSYRMASRQKERTASAGPKTKKPAE